MRAKIDGLIRLYRWQLDEKRRHLAELENMRQDFEDKVRHLKTEVEREKAFASQAPERSLGFAEFVAASNARQRAVLNSIVEIDAQIEAARAEVQDGFQELKKIETFDARKRQQNRARADRRAQSRMDEIGIERHRRASGR